MITPKQLHELELEKKKFQYDAAQMKALTEFDRLYKELIGNGHFFSSFFKKLTKKPKGIYLWGGVGRGKTYLADTFYTCLPIKNKIRMHYHKFMKMIHDDFIHFKGNKDPLLLIAKKIANNSLVVVLDEFFVKDIADAMMLGQLMHYLFEYGVVLIITSNLHPDMLYHNGLHHDRFLPAIKSIKTNMIITDLESSIDYRLRNLEKASMYHYPIDNASEKIMEETFLQLAKGFNIEEHNHILIEGRLILTKKLAHGIVWFHFKDLCDGPRGSDDYIFLAKEFHTIFLEHAPAMTCVHDNMMLRFINLIDVLYDHSVNLIMSAEAPMSGLYNGSRLKFEFKRTLSRLKEMQSMHYLSSKHKS